MRINRLFTLAFVLITVYFISSCATTSPKEKLLIGTWKPVKASPYMPVTKAAPAVVPLAVTDSGAVAEQKKPQAKSLEAVTEERRVNQLQRLIEQQMKTTLMIKADKTCEIQVPGKALEAKWKLKKKGTIMYVKEVGGSRKVNLELVNVTDSAVMAIQRTKTGDIIIKYQKQ